MVDRRLTGGMVDDKKLLFYDIEVFAKDVVIVFKNIDKVLIAVFHNDFEGIEELVENWILVGYNNYWYDDYILTGVLNRWSNYQIKKLNDSIIGGGRVKRKLDGRIKSLDCFQQLYQSPGLKRVEGNMGLSIKESAVGFDIDRELTVDELAETFEYCMYDVDSTVEVYKRRKYEYFVPKQGLLDMLNKPGAERWNTTTIATNLLVDKAVPKWSEMRGIPWDLVPGDDVRMMWEQVNEHGGEIKVKTVTRHEFGCELAFGFGGLHGVNKTVKRVKDVVLLDVASFYPSIIINLEALGMGTKKYVDIRDERLKAKADGDWVRSDALKLVLNSVFGLMNNQYSNLYNERANRTVCVYGQIMLYELCRRVAPYGDIININTDGIVFLPKSVGYKKVVEGWQKEFNFQLDEKGYDLFIQRDVNNYVAVVGDEVITKGGDVARYQADNLWSNNNARIVDIAIVEKLVNGTDVIDTIVGRIDQPYLFQYVLQAGHTYRGVCDEGGNMVGKVNRVFAGRGGGTTCLYKLRYDDGRVRFADAPEKMLIWNGDCGNVPGFRGLIDVDHYYQLTLKKLERWT